jgi:hypothetical protein
VGVLVKAVGWETEERSPQARLFGSEERKCFGKNSDPARPLRAGIPGCDDCAELHLPLYRDAGYLAGKM